jgi:hypothetical protein
MKRVRLHLCVVLKRWVAVQLGKGEARPSEAWMAFQKALELPQCFGTPGPDKRLSLKKPANRIVWALRESSLIFGDQLLVQRGEKPSSRRPKVLSLKVEIRRIFPEGVPKDPDLCAGDFTSVRARLAEALDLLERHCRVRGRKAGRVLRRLCRHEAGSQYSCQNDAH